MKRFGKFKFRRNPSFRYKSNTIRFQRGGSSSSGGTKGGYKTGTIDRARSRCFNCNELGHYSTECKTPKQVKKEYSSGFQKKKAGNAYVALGKSRDDTDSDDEEISLMAFEDGTPKATKEVGLTEKQINAHLMHTLDYAQREMYRIKKAEH